MRGPEQLGPYTIFQPEGVFPLGEDALALGGSFATVRRDWKVCDLGTGSGVLLLLLAGREPTLRLSGVERDPLAAQAARDNLKRNGLAGAIWTGGWGDAPFAPGSFDLAVSNPPYFAPGSGGDGGPARMEGGAGSSLESLCRAAARLVRNGGRFALCSRPERLAALFAALGKNGLEPKRLQFAAYSPAHPPYLALVEAVRQGRPGLEVLPGRYRNHL